jgi:inosose dehydratase
MPTRRHFLQWAGVGAAASLAARHGFAEEPALSKTQPAKNTPKRRYELGVASYTFHKLPLDKALALTNRVGLKHICLNPIHLPVESTPEQITQTVAKVKAAGLDLYAGGVIYMNSPADVDRAFDYAKAAGMRRMVGVPLHELLPLVNKKVQQYDIPVAIHNHGPGDKVYPTPNVAYEKIKDLDPRIGLCVDIGYVVRSGLDLNQVVEQFADRLLDFHVKDVSAATAHGETVEVGRGVIDIPQFLRTLDKLGYAGMISFEFEKDPDDPLAGLAESVGYVRGALAVI